MTIENASEISLLTKLPTKKVIDAMQWYENQCANSLDALTTTSEGETYARYEFYNSKEDDTTQLFVDEFLEGMEEDVREIIILQIKGYGQRDISRMRGIPQSKISRVIKKVRVEYQEKYERGV